VNEKTPDVPVMDIDGKQYAVADLTSEQHNFAAQIHDLEEQLRLNEFKHQQLLFGRTAYIQALKKSLEAPPDGGQPE
jgi:hypothetical protein